MQVKHMIFWNKKEKPAIKTDYLEEIAHLKSRITRLEAEVLDIMTAQEVIRDKVLRKIRLKSRTEDEENDTETWGGIPKTKEINKSAL